MSGAERDAFETLRLEHRLSLRRDEIEAAYHALSRECHPDAGGTTEAFADLSWARDVLLSPARRARHLLDLAWPGTSLAGDMPTELLDLFEKMTSPLAAADELLRKRAKGVSVLQKALIEREALQLEEALESCGQAVSQAMAAIEASFAQWDGDGEKLIAMARSLAFLEKWDAQVREKRLLLTLPPAGCA